MERFLYLPQELLTLGSLYRICNARYTLPGDMDRQRAKPSTRALAYRTICGDLNGELTK